MKVRLVMERRSPKTFETRRKAVTVEIPDTDNLESDEKGVWVIMGYSEVKDEQGQNNRPA